MVSRAVPYHKLLSITTTFQTAVTLNCVCRCGGESGTRVFQAKLTELQADQPAATPPKPSSRFRPRASQTPRTDSGTSTLDSNPSPPKSRPALADVIQRRRGRGESVVNGTSSSRDSHAPPRARSRPLRPPSRLRSLRPAVREPPRAEDAPPILTG